MKTFLVLVMLILLESGMAYAADDMLDKLDANRDGKIDTQEFTSTVSKTFQLYDKNKDGYIDLKEFSTLPLSDPKKRFNEIDTNKDGRIDYPEFLGAATKWFNTVDADKDRSLNRTEFNTVRGSSSIGLFLRLSF